MKTLIFSVIFIFGFMIQIFAQSNQLITREGKRYYQNNRELTAEDIKRELTSLPDAADEYQKARSNMTAGMIFLGSGVTFALIGSIMNLSNTTKDANNVKNGSTETSDNSGGLTMALIGLGATVVSLPFLISGSSHMKKSVNLYNGYKSNSLHYKTKLELNATASSVGLRLKF
jgi:hypothetical protein